MIKTKYPTTKPSLNLDFANTKSLDPRITFRRGTPGTYYDGVTHVKAEENLLKHSENFTDSLWSKLGTSLETTTEIAPDGSQNAYFLKQNSANSQHAIYARDLADLGKTYSISIYAKAGAVSRILFASVFTSEHVLYDLSSGEFERYTYSSKLIKSYNMESVGNGWYRCSIVYESAISDNGIGLYLLDDNDEASFVGDNSSGVYIWGAQLEQRDAVTSYTATTGTPITKYQPKLMTASPDDARFDHDPITGESKGLLIEEQRTNLIDYSEDFSSGGWNKVRLERVETDTIISPDGKLSGEKYIQEDGNLEGGNLNKIITLTSGITYTSSVYAKKGQFNQIRLFENNVNDSVETTIFSLDDGTLVSQSTYHDSYSITDIGNGWYRFSITFTASSTATTLVGFYLHDSSSVTGNGYKGTYIWGAQVEAGSFATSYIKTSGASATRSADNASITGENFSSWYRQDEGSVYLEAKYNSGSGERSYQRGVLGFTVNDQNPVTESIIFYNRNGYSSGLGINKNGVYSVLLTGGKLDDFDYFKSSFAYKENDVSLAANVNSGAQLLSDNTCEIPYLNSLTLGAIHEFDDERLNGHIKKLAYYPQRLTNEQLQNLTK